jgi:hypothetical protein
MLAIGAGAVVVGGAVVVVAGAGGDGARSASSAGTPTTTISRRDLVEVQTEDGTLGYADSRTVVNRLAGTVTWLPRAGAVVRTNARLYAVDANGVYLLDGSVPAYRDLAPGSSGKDVGELERNMRALGKDPGGAMRVDGTWDAGTTAAVKRWQRDKGLEPTGTIELGRVVFAPGARRVSSLALKVGASAGSGSSASGGGGSQQPASYDGADATSSAMRFVAYTAPAGDGTGEPQAATTTAPGSTSPQAATTTAPSSTTPQTATTPQTTTIPPTTPTPKPPPKTPAAPKPTSPSASRGGGGGLGGSGSGSGSGSGGSGSRGSGSGSGGSGSGRSGSAGGGSGSGSGSGSGASSAPSTNLMTTTSTRRIVTVALDTTKESVAVQGARVTVELPSGDAVHGRIARVGTTATSEQASDGSSSPPTIKLTIKLTEAAKAIDQAPVTVQLERSRRRHVLAIPVTALMARTGGTFAVEVVDSGGRRVVPVTTGLFTSGFVEIDGSGLRPGMRVANAAV